MYMYINALHTQLLESDGIGATDKLICLRVLVFTTAVSQQHSFPVEHVPTPHAVVAGTNLLEIKHP